MTEPHEDFRAAPAPSRWTRSLAELAVVLRHGAWEHPGEWTWRILPRGAMVAMRARSDQRKEVRISRREEPKDEKARNRWIGECVVFLKHLGCDHWTAALVHDTKAKVLYVEPHVTCARCGRECSATPHKRPLCTGCAIALGQEEVAQRAAQAVSSSPPEGTA